MVAIRDCSAFYHIVVAFTTIITNQVCIVVIRVSGEIDHIIALRTYNARYIDQLIVMVRITATRNVATIFTCKAEVQIFIRLTVIDNAVCV